MQVPTETHEEYEKFYSKLYKDGYPSTASQANRRVKDLSNAGVFGSYGFKTILEIGCGTGWLARNLLTRQYSLAVTEICSRAVEDELHELRVFPYGAYDLGNFEDDSFDCVIAIDVLDATRTKKESLCIVQEAARISRRCFICSVNGELLWQKTNLQTLKKSSTWWRKLLEHHFGTSSEMTELKKGQMFLTWHENTEPT